MELTEKDERGRLIDLDEFAGLPMLDPFIPQPSLWSGEGDFNPVPGQWVDEQTLAAGIIWLCADTEVHGLYHLQLSDLTAVKVAELPQP